MSRACGQSASGATRLPTWALFAAPTRLITDTMDAVAYSRSPSIACIQERTSKSICERHQHSPTAVSAAKRVREPLRCAAAAVIVIACGDLQINTSLERCNALRKS